MARAVGVGGLFVNARDPAKLSARCAEHLGIPSEDDGALTFDGPISRPLRSLRILRGARPTLGRASSRPCSTSVSTI